MKLEFEIGWMLADGGMMTRTCARAALAVILVASFSIAISPARAQSKSTDADSSAIRQVIADFIYAFNRHAAHACAMPIAEDDYFSNVTGLYLLGRKVFEVRFTELFAGPLT